MRHTRYTGHAGWSGRVVVLAAVLAATPVAAGRAADSLADLVAQVAPAVASISGKRLKVPEKIEGSAPEKNEAPADKRPRDRRAIGRLMAPGPLASVGAGIVIDPSGLVVTSEHVIAEVEDLHVTVGPVTAGGDRLRLPARILGGDRLADIALLKVDAPGPLPFLRLADSDAVRVGDRVLSIGDPFGFEGTVTAGLVSGLGRITEDNAVMALIQHDAALNMGNSGGPALNMAGAVIGLNSAIYSPTGSHIGLSFAIPANQVRRVVEQLRDHGRVDAGWIGAEVQPVTDDIADGLGLEQADGAIVVRLAPSGPAARAGLRLGDVVASLDDRPIIQANDLTRHVYHTAPGTPVVLAVRRDGAGTAVTVTVGHAPDEDGLVVADDRGDDLEPAADLMDRLGVDVAGMTPEVRRHLGPSAADGGVVVTGVADEGLGAAGGIRRGDRILAVEQVLVSTPEAFAAAIRGVADADRKTLVLLVERQGERQFIATRLRP